VAAFLGLGRTDAILAGDMGCPVLRSHTSAGGPMGDDSLVAAVKAVVPTDILVPTAFRVDCAEHRLPSSRPALAALLAEQHGRLIGECGRGRTAVKRGLQGFDLLSLLNEPPEETDDTATIRAFFDTRPVDVALGKAVSEGAYTISFDWAIVLDHESHAVYSFILNCSD